MLTIRKNSILCIDIYRISYADIKIMRNQSVNSKALDLSAAIITYNPNISRLSENISALLPGVNNLLIVDNASSNYDEILQLKSEIDDDNIIFIIKNNKNMGIANALNTALNWAEENGYLWMLTLDQDSVCMPGFVENTIPLLSNTKAGIFSPCITGDKVNESVLSKSKRSKLLMPITSGAVTNVKAALKTGGYNDDYFIDCVDFDMNLKLLKNGYEIIENNKVFLSHRLGEPFRFKLFGMITLSCSGHNSIRNYYIIRNAFFLFYNHKNFAFCFTLKKISDHIKVAILNFIGGKVSFKCVLYGLYDGLLFKIRPHEEILSILSD